MDPQTADGMSSAIIKKIAAQFKSGYFRFKPIRRIYMDRSGKNPASEAQNEKLKKLHKEGNVSMAQIKENLRV
jgi:hypothetical protein